MARKPVNPNNSWKSKVKSLKSRLASKGLSRTPFNNFDEDTDGGILGVGLLRKRPRIESHFSDTLENVKGNPVYTSATISNYTYFFIKRENPSIRGDEEKQFSFYVVEAITPISIPDCAKQLGLPTSDIKTITEDELKYGFFRHPIYINGTYEHIKIYYGELTFLVQDTAGRMDNLPFGYPAFNYNPSPTVTSSGNYPPSAPYTFFYTKDYPVDAVKIVLPTKGVVQFIDLTPTLVEHISPTWWSWDFGSDFASPTGSTGQYPYVDFSALPTGAAEGSYDVSLTTGNAYGQKTYTRSDYIESQGIIYMGEAYASDVLLGYSLRQLTDDDVDVIRVKRSSGGTPFGTANIFTASEILNGDVEAWVTSAPGISTTDGLVVRMYQQFPTGVRGDAADLFPASDAEGPKIVDAGNLVTLNGKPAMYFDGTSNLITGPFGGHTVPLTAYTVSSIDAIGPEASIISGSTESNIIWIDPTGVVYTNEYASSIISADGAQQILYSVYDPNSSILGKNDILDENVPGNNYNITKFQIGQFNGTKLLEGHFQEALIFNRNMNTGATGDGGDLSIIKNKINKYYNTY